MGAALFDTAIGACGLAWGERGVVRIYYPDEGLAGRLAAEVTAPPTVIADAIAGIQALLRGAPRDLQEVPLDMDGVPPFHQRVYTISRQILPGHTLTYGEVAKRLGSPGSARAVGQALGANPFSIVVPCHRVLAAGYKLGGFSAPGGGDTKRRVLAIEGALAPGTLTLFERGRS